MLNPQLSTSCSTTFRPSCMTFNVLSRSPTSSLETTSISLSSLPAATACATSTPCASGRVTTLRMNTNITNSIGRVSNTAATMVCMRWRATASLVDFSEIFMLTAPRTVPSGTAWHVMQFLPR